MDSYNVEISNVVLEFLVCLLVEITNYIKVIYVFCPLFNIFF